MVNAHYSSSAPTTNRELVDLVLENPWEFNPEWLSSGPKIVIPMVGLSPLDGDLAARLSSGASEVGTEYGLIAATEPDYLDDPLSRVSMTKGHLVGVSWPRSNYVIALSNLSGAALFTVEGYLLLAGIQPFVQGCLIEGVDHALAQFSRNARRLAGSRPILLQVANAFPARWTAWSSPAQVPPNSGVGEQLELMNAVVAGQTPPVIFAQRWLSARRRSLAQGERLRGKFDEVLNSVFYMLDDYVIDPSLREPGDMSDDDLVVRVRGALEDLERV